MAQADLVKLVKEHIAAFSAKDWNRYSGMLTDDAIYEEEATHQRLQGKQALVDFIKKWAVAFPDLKGTVKEAFSAGDKVVVEVLWEGTHNGQLSGPIGNLAATGKKGSLPAVEVFTFENGKISEMRHYFDLMTLLGQIGAMPRIGGQATP